MGTTRSTSRGLDHNRSRTVLQVISVVVAIEIALHSFIVKEPILTLIGAALWLGGVFWTRRGGSGGPIAIGALASYEILASLFFSEEFAAEGDIATWIIVLHLASVAGALIAAIAAVIGARVPMRQATSS